MIRCDQIINATDNVSTNIPTNVRSTVSTNATSNALINVHNKKVDIKWIVIFCKWFFSGLINIYNC